MPEYDFFTPTAGLEQIHQAALRILAEIGVEMDHVEMRERLAGLGCCVTGARVTIPPDLVAATLAAIPPGFQLYGRTPAIAARVDADGPMLCTNTGILPNIFDLDTGAVRRATLADVAATTRILDALAERGHRLCLAAGCHRPTGTPDHPGRLRGHAGEHHQAADRPRCRQWRRGRGDRGDGTGAARPGAGALSGLRPVHLPDHPAALPR